jgi:trigger factor
MNGSSLTQVAPTVVALEFSLTDDDLAAAEDRAFRRLAKNLRLPGFRKGRVPRKIFEQTYGSSAITTEAVEEVVPMIYAKAVREHDLEPVEHPKFEVVEETAGRPKRLKATVEVRPEIALGRYRGVSVTRPPITVSEADVERSLEALAKERATLIPVERPARLGDIVTLDYEGTIDGKAFEGGRGERETVELSESRFIPGFAAGIVGMSPGETKQLELRFPEDYVANNLAGKQAVFSLALHEIKEVELPPIDDAFAQAVSENQTVAQLRDDLHRRLQAVAAGRARRSIGNAVLEQLLATHDFPLPASMVDNELKHIIEDMAAASSEGEKSEAELREAYRGEAQARVKATLLIQAIAKAENITAMPADVTAELEALARRYGQPVPRIRKLLGNNLRSLMDGIVRNKTLDLLIDDAIVTTDQETAPAVS